MQMNHLEMINCRRLSNS